MLLETRVQVTLYMVGIRAMRGLSSKHLERGGDAASSKTLPKAERGETLVSPFFPVLHLPNSAPHCLNLGKSHRNLGNRILQEPAPLRYKAK